MIVCRTAVEPFFSVSSGSGLSDHVQGEGVASQDARLRNLLVSKSPLRSPLSGEHDVRRVLGGLMFGDAIAERRQVDSGE